MSRVAIVTDSTADLPEPLRAAAGIVVVPVDVWFDGEAAGGGSDLSADAFLTRLAEATAPPVVAPPVDVFRGLANAHAEIVAVCGSSRLSDTVEAATRAAAIASDVPVEVVDSRSASMGLGFQALRAADLAAAGWSGPAIASRLRAETDRYPVLFALDTLDYLERGGRVSRAAALIGGLLQLKPLLWLDEGQVAPLERTRTRRRALDGLVAFVRDMPAIERIAVLHGSEPAVAADLAARIAAATGVDPREIVLSRLGPLIVTYAGPGALGVAVQTGV
jgi:DegV family protein with EDD domain